MVREKYVIVLSIVIFFLIVLLLFKFNILSRQNLVYYKDAITVTKDIITIVVIVIGGFFSYFKFFAGQTFSPKAELEFDIVIIETPKKLLLHTVKVTVINKGSLSIWNPAAQIKVAPWGIDNADEEEELFHQFADENFLDKNSELQTVVDPGEKIYYVIWREFNMNTWAVTYTAQVSSKNNLKWQNTVTIPNTVT